MSRLILSRVHQLQFSHLSCFIVSSSSSALVGSGGLKTAFLVYYHHQLDRNGDQRGYTLAHWHMRLPECDWVRLHAPNRDVCTVTIQDNYLYSPTPTQFRNYVLVVAMCSSWKKHSGHLCTNESRITNIMLLVSTVFTDLYSHSLKGKWSTDW